MSGSHEPVEQRSAPRIVAIVNLRSGGWKRLHDPAVLADKAAAVARWIAPETPDSVRVELMRAADDGARLAREAIADGCDTLVAVGGDGTLNDVVQGVQSVQAGESTRLGLIPMGTANVLSRILGIPRNEPEKAGQIVREGRERTIDLGRMGGRWFALVAGVGFDGAVTRSVNPRLKRRLSEGAYLLAASRLALTYPRRHITLTLDGGEPLTFDAYLVLIANGGQYGGRYRLSAEVLLNDGLLDVFVCLRRRPLARGILAHGLALVRDRFDQAEGVRHFRARHITLDADSPLPVELDGDSAGMTPISIEVVPNALRIIAPA